MRRSRGFVLITVLGAIAVLAVVAGALAARVDALRQQSADLQQAAREQIAQHNALSAALYWLGTRTPGAAGWAAPGEGADQIVIADGREYDLDDEALVSFHDQTGLVSVNIVDRIPLTNLLLHEGVSSGRVDAMIDILEDYTDIDNLKRLNGAEAAEYEAAGLPPPRNDWMISTRELQNMPVWREELQRAPGIERLLSARRSAGINPDTAPVAVLAGVITGVAPETLQQFDRLRRERPFDDGLQAQRATGLPVAPENYVFAVSNQVYVRVRAKGSPRGREYNVLLTPNRRTSPWVITEHHAMPAPIASDASIPAVRFPFPFLLANRSDAPATAAR